MDHPDWCKYCSRIGYHHVACSRPSLLIQIHELILERRKAYDEGKLDLVTTLQDKIVTLFKEYDRCLSL